MPDGSQTTEQNKEELSAQVKYLVKAFEEVPGLCRLARQGDFIPGWIDKELFKKYFKVEFSAVSGRQYTCPATRLSLTKQAAEFLEKEGIELDLDSPPHGPGIIFPIIYIITSRSSKKLYKSGSSSYSGDCCFTSTQH